MPLILIRRQEAIHMIGEKAKPMGPSSRNCLGAIVFEDEKEALTLRNRTFTMIFFSYRTYSLDFFLGKRTNHEVEVELICGNADSWEAGHVK